MIRAIIVEDEPSSRDLLVLMLERYKQDIELLDVCPNPNAGIDSILKNKPDLVFLDIHMPKMSGFDMLNKLKPIHFEVIFTTAFDQYAMNAIKMSALDYLLKPIEHDELTLAIQKARERLNQRNTKLHYEHLLGNLNQRNPMDKTIALSGSEGVSFVKSDDIIRVEAIGRYSKFYLVNKEVIVIAKTLGDFEETLSANQFFRIHDSYLVNLQHVRKYLKGDGGTVVLSDNTQLDVARRRKEAFIKLMSKL